MLLTSDENMICENSNLHMEKQVFRPKFRRTDKITDVLERSIIEMNLKFKKN